ncbi:ABC transporter ATP-binding protein [Pseudobacteriovorax antillogorgiicola]|uniref:ABC-2 type transport system ATP-binding protein n=1 Tax=Pseudobacteriovorax antillogorgiicola TaxID=1513793 RepID=A0A1Y6CMT5_9BACT|nr:ATP-binding cassette domain-containing protein [Pseudobacteriovorax antillogorgiicola]TCS47336.1 ABC-2 type transport system ATP-binding protein [Pseudobacteriovorax antillogorgiicola]SMF63099.1 ABC-2 type transport system ATP-binding protein [Pseudobacteriovorax antillogorgiicola]
MDEISLACNGLTKTFKKYIKKPGVIESFKSLVRRDFEIGTGVDHFDLEIRKGELVGLLGPNGAGKTTLMKMFSGIIVPSSGACQVLGHTPHRRAMAFRKKIALVMGQKGQLWWDIPAMDSFLLLQKYYEIDEQRFKQRLGHLADSLGVSTLLNVHVRRLSLGERMKMELIACLLHEPEIIFLDEPTIGLDLISQQTIRAFIADYQQRNGTTIVLTSHYMADIDALCDRIVLIFDGKKTYDGSIEDFGSILGREKFLTVQFEQAVDQTDSIWSDLDPKWLSGGQKVELRVPEEQLRQRTIDILQKFPAIDFQTEKLPVERVMHTILANPEILE